MYDYRCLTNMDENRFQTLNFLYWYATRPKVLVWTEEIFWYVKIVDTSINFYTTGHWTKELLWSFKTSEYRLWKILKFCYDLSKKKDFFFVHVLSGTRLCSMKNEYDL